MVTYFKTLNTGSISDGSYAEKTWTPNTDIVIKKVLLVERSDISLSNAQVYISIAAKPYTFTYVPGSAIGSDLEYCWKPDLEVSKGSEIYFKIVNNTGSSINVDIVIEFERK